jgi:RNA polymerase sigma-70 factor, ECF subfamily
MEFDDRNDFAEQIVRNQHRIFGYIVTLMGNRDDAEDVFQGTCLILWRKWEEFDRSRDFFRWACGIAHNEARNQLRRNQRQRLRLSDDLLRQLAEIRIQADDFLEARGRFLALCLDKLSDPQRQLLEECYLGDMPIKTIAEAMDISPAALTMRLQRIRKTLFECMDLALKEERGDSP